jgi:hypothetical protein
MISFTIGYVRKCSIIDNQTEKRGQEKNAREVKRVRETELEREIILKWYLILGHQNATGAILLPLQLETSGNLVQCEHAHTRPDPRIVTVSNAEQLGTRNTQMEKGERVSEACMQQPMR